MTGKENAAAIHVYESLKYIPEEEQGCKKRCKAEDTNVERVIYLN